MEEYRRKQDKTYRASSEVQETFNDEELRRAEIRNARAIQEKREFNEMMSKMAADKERQESMRRQEVLKTELKLAYKQGDMATVRRLEKVLAPDENTGGSSVKHPWA